MRKLLLIPLMICIAGCNSQIPPSSIESGNTESAIAHSDATDLYSDWKTYSESFPDYKEVSFRYPADWTLDKENHVLYFIVNGETYKFGYYMGTEVDTDAQNRSLEKYNGINFVRTEFMKKGQVFLVVYQVNQYQSESTFGVYDGLQGDVPPENGDSYIKLFDGIMKSIKITKM